MVHNKGYKTYQTGHVSIKLTSHCVTLHCTNYPRPLSSVSNSGQNSKTRVWGAEKRNPGKRGFFRVLK